MAVAFDSLSGDTASSTDTITVSHTIGTGGSDTVLIVLCQRSATGGPTGVTYNGTSMTALTTNPVDYPAGGDGSWFYLFNPDTGGAHDIVATWASSGNLNLVASAYTGVDSGNFPDDTDHYQTGATAQTNHSVSSDSTVNNCLLIGGGIGDAGTASAGAGTTMRKTVQSSDGMNCSIVEADSITASPGSDTVAITYTSAARGGMESFFLAPSSAAAGRDARKLTLLGVG